MDFQIHALPTNAFASLFALSDAQLAEHGARRVVADEPGAYPCRVSLADADVGDELILTNYSHLDEHSPYRASHAIYVRKDVTRAVPDPGDVPEVLAKRLLSVRAFTSGHMMALADVVDGSALAESLRSMFADPAVDYVHIHNAKQGCFAAKATRAHQNYTRAHQN